LKARTYAFLTGFIVLTLAAAATRMLTSAFGNSAANSIAVVFSILLGLVLGVYYFSSRYSRAGSQARVLGLIQVATALCLLVLISVLPVMHRAYAFVHSLGPTSPGALLATRAVLTLAVLIIPSFLLGGAYAFIALTGSCASGARTCDSAGVAFMGLAAAVPLVTLVLLPRLGVSLTLALAAVTSAAMGGLSMLGPAGAPQTVTSPGRGFVDIRPFGPVAAGALLISFSVISQILLCMRVLTQVTGANAYTLVANSIVATLAISAGALLTARLMSGQRSGFFCLGLFGMIAAIYTLVIAGIVDTLPVRFLRYIDFGEASGAAFTAAYFYLAAITLLVPALLMGALLGVAETLSGRASPGGAGLESRGPGGGLRRLMLPAGFAALLAYAAALPVVSAALGLEKGLMFAAWLCLAGGAAVIAGSAGGPLRQAGAVAAGIVAALALTITHSPWNRSALTSGAYANPRAYANLEDPWDAVGRSDIAFYAEDLEGVVAVIRTPDGTFMKRNGKVLGAASEKIGPDIMAAHVPMLLHKHPEKVLLLGLGTGVTLGSVQRYEVSSITVAEPAATIIRAAALFSPYSNNALEDKRTTVQRQCPRSYMRLADQKYDVVIGQASAHADPIHASTTTLDFMLLARSVLSYDGIFCLEVDLRDASRECLMTTVNGFLAGFPYVSAWYAGSGEILLVGSMESHMPSVGAIGAKLERTWVSNDLKRLQINDEAGALANLMMDRDALRAYLGAYSRRNSDGRPGLECSAMPFNAPGDAVATLADFNRFRVNPVTLMTGYDEDSIEYKIARDKYGRCRDASNYYVRSYEALGSGNEREAAQSLEYGLSLCSANGLMKERLSYLYLQISRELVAAGRFEEAINVARRAIEVSPVSYLAFYNLAMLERMRDLQTAVALLERLGQLNPYYLPADILRAELLLESGRPADASEAISEVLSREPMNHRAHHIRGLCFVERGLTEAARVEFEFVVDADPENADALAALGYTWLLIGDIGKAEKYYARALDLEPENLGVLNNYATVLAERGDYREAIIVWQRALKLDPTNAGIKANIQEATQKMSGD
jgi:spermidine synthase